MSFYSHGSLNGKPDAEIFRFFFGVAPLVDMLSARRSMACARFNCRSSAPGAPVISGFPRSSRMRPSWSNEFAWPSHPCKRRSIYSVSRGVSPKPSRVCALAPAASKASIMRTPSRRPLALKRRKAAEVS